MRAKIYLGHWFICHHCDRRVTFRNDGSQLPSGASCSCGASFLRTDLEELAYRDLLAASFEFDCPMCKRLNIVMPRTEQLFNEKLPSGLRVRAERLMPDARTSCQHCGGPIELCL